MQPSKKVFDEYSADVNVRQEALRHFEVGQMQAEKIGINGLSPDNLAVNICFQRVIISDLLLRIVLLENQLKELTNSTPKGWPL